MCMFQMLICFCVYVSSVDMFRLPLDQSSIVLSRPCVVLSSLLKDFGTCITIICTPFLSLHSTSSTGSDYYIIINKKNLGRRVVHTLRDRNNIPQHRNNISDVIENIKHIYTFIEKTLAAWEYRHSF
eukprot:GHVR01129308.1.p1 GENE.GHVR01129308.1~~GHVR01129308.1.p1  ORF type:complete len:127 (+),score=6.55 GHVR01129308.1:217-597(+)